MKKSKEVLLSFNIILFNVLFLCFCSVSFAQDYLNKSYDELVKNWREVKNIKGKEIYFNAILKRAKIEKDTIQLIKGHHLAALTYTNSNKIKHCDSLILLSKVKPNVNYPVIGYILKGSTFFRARNFQKATHNYLLANKYAREYQNEKFIIQSNYYIGILKDRIGLHEEALELHSENYRKIKHNRTDVNDQDFLTYMFALANTFNDLKQIDSASFYNKLGKKESKKTHNDAEYFHFVLNDAVTQYLDQRYLRSLDSIKKAIKYLETFDDKQNCAVGYFYAGKSYLKLKKDDEAIKMFKKVDTVFINDKYVLPKLREAYEILVNHYKKKSNTDKQLLYITRLMTLDSVLNRDEIYLNKKIVLEYDTPRLILEKENIISKLQQNKKKSFTIIYFLSAFLILTIGIVYYQYKKRAIYKERFKQFLNEKPDPIAKVVSNGGGNLPRLNISSEIVDDILEKLQNFEDVNGYLTPGVNLKDLAKSMNTNANYLSKVVNYFKKESFINYLNGLRINYSISQLKSNPKFRCYTVKAIANEVGFSNTQSFSKAFKSRTGIMPSYFIRQLEKNTTYS